MSIYSSLSSSSNGFSFNGLDASDYPYLSDFPNVYNGSDQLGAGIEDSDLYASVDETNSNDENHPVSLSTENFSSPSDLFAVFQDFSPQLQTAESPSLQGRLTTESLPLLAPQPSVLSSEFAASSHEPEVSSSRKRKRDEEIPSAHKKQRRETKNQQKELDSNQISSREKKRLRDQELRLRKKEEFEALKIRVQELKDKVMKLYQRYEPDRSMELELESFLAENEIVTTPQDDTWEREELEETLEGLSNKQKQVKMRKFDHKITSRTSRAKKKDYENSLKLQQEFLEKKMMEIASRVIVDLNPQNASLLQEKESLREENENLKREKIDLTQENESLKQENVQTQMQAMEWQQEHKKLQDTVIETLRVYKKLSQENESLKQENVQTQMQAMEWQQEHKKLQDIVIEVFRNYQKLSQENDKLSQENTLLHQEQGCLTWLRQEYGKLQQENDMLSQENAMLRHAAISAKSAERNSPPQQNVTSQFNRAQSEQYSGVPAYPPDHLSKQNMASQPSHNPSYHMYSPPSQPKYSPTSQPNSKYHMYSSEYFSNKYKDKN